MCRGGSLQLLPWIFRKRRSRIIWWLICGGVAFVSLINHFVRPEFFMLFCMALVGAEPAPRPNDMGSAICVLLRCQLAVAVQTCNPYIRASRVTRAPARTAPPLKKKMHITLHCRCLKCKWQQIADFSPWRPPMWGRHAPGAEPRVA